MSTENKAYATESEQKRGAGGRPLISKKRSSGLIIGPLIFLAVMVAPTSLSGPQQSLLGVIVFTITFWVFQPIPIPITSVLGLALAVVFDVASAREVFGAFSSPTLFLLIGGFLITQSMSKHGLGHRLALQVMSIPGMAGSTYRMVIGFGALATLLSGVIDNGAVAAMLLPISLGLIRTFSDDIAQKADIENTGQPLRFSAALLLMTAYGSTLGALLTPFGDASNLVGWHFIQTNLDTPLTVGTWMLLGTPIVASLFVLLAALVLFVNRPEVRKIPNAKLQIAQSRHRLGRLSRGEINTAIVFGLAVLLWLSPPLVTVLFGSSSALYVFLEHRLPPSVVAILAAVLLFVMPLKRGEGFTMRWRDAARMDWGPLLLVGSALALGTLMGETGLAKVMGETLAEQIHGVGAIWVYVFAAAIAIAMSELTSNLVSISVLVPIIPTLAAAGGGNPNEAALVATFAAVYGFMLPISTSANAIVYSSGQIPLGRMIRTGFLVDLSGIAVVVTGVLIMIRLAGVI